MSWVISMTRAVACDSGDDAFHGPHKVVRKPKIRGKSDQPIRHVLIRL